MEPSSSVESPPGTKTEARVPVASLAPATYRLIFANFLPNDVFDTSARLGKTLHLKGR